MSQYRKVFVFKDVNYGSSKTSTTVNTATNPADLADGAIGVYAIHKAGSTNLNKIALVTNGGSEAAGLIPVASLVADEIVIALGTSNGVILSMPIFIAAGRHRFTGKAYTVPVKGISVIGYTSAGGLLNFPATIAKGDLLSVGATNERSLITGDRQPFVKERYSVELAAGDSAYTALVKLIKKMTALDPTQDRTIVDIPIIVSNASGSAFGNSATATVTNNSTAVTTSAAHTVTAGQYIVLGTDLYIASAVTSTTITLDRPYTGASATIANANTINTASTTAPTQLGLQFTDANFYENVILSEQGVLENATITRTTVPLQGSGTPDHTLRMEKEFRSMLGTSDEITSYIPKEPYKTDATKTYDMYICEINNPGQPGAGNPLGSVFKVINHLMLFFVVAANTGGKNQADFEDIMQSSVLFGSTAFPTIS